MVILGLIVTAAAPLLHPTTRNLIGVTATDAKFSFLFSDVTQYKLGVYSYAFLVNREGM